MSATQMVPSPERKELENKILSHDKTLHSLVIAIRRLMDPPVTSNKRPIGFHPWDDENEK